jgi:hypothetical protein
MTTSKPKPIKKQLRVHKVRLGSGQTRNITTVYEKEPYETGGTAWRINEVAHENPYR